MASKLCCVLLLLSLVCYAALGGRQEQTIEEELVDLVGEEVGPCGEEPLEEEEEQSPCENAQETTDEGNEAQDCNIPEEDTVTNMNCASKPANKLQKTVKKIEAAISKTSAVKCPCEQEATVEETPEEETAPAEEPKSGCTLSKTKKSTCSKCTANQKETVSSVTAKSKKVVKMAATSCSGKSCAGSGKTKREVKQKGQKQTAQTTKNSKQMTGQKQNKITKSPKSNTSKNKSPKQP